MFDEAVRNAPVFLLVAARCFALLMTIPLFSTRTVHKRVKVSLAGGMAFMIFPKMSLLAGNYSAYSPYIFSDENFSLEFVFLLVGEAMIGIIMGLFVQIIFAAFSTAGQFFAFQMGFSASEVYDALSQVENPLMGQFLNFLAIIVFLNNSWLLRIFLDALYSSFDAINVFSIVSSRESIALFMMKSLSILFRDALVLALPVMASLFLVNVSVGILTKAAPQMNLLSEAFPALILMAFYLIQFIVPYAADFFQVSFRHNINHLLKFLTGIAGGSQ